jgi:putative oxidoreductase
LYSITSSSLENPFMTALNTGLLILRLVVGIGLAAHGAQKLFGWWGGPGVRGLLGHLTHMRFRPAPLWVAGAIATEIGGGLLLALGFLSPLGSVGVGASMLMAIVAFHWGKGFFGQSGGFESPFLYLIAAATIGMTGPGSYSLDSLFKIALPEPVTGIVAALLAVAGVAVGMAGRRPVPAVAQPSTEAA